MKRFLILMALAVPSSFMLMGASNHVWIDNPYAAPSGVNAQGTPFTSTPTGSPTPTVTNTPTPVSMTRGYERNVVTWNPVSGVVAVFTPTSGLPFDGFLIQGKMASNALASSGSATVQGLVDNGAGNFVAGFTSVYTTGTAGGTGFYIVPGATFPTSPFSGVGLQIANYTPTPAVTPVVTVTILYRR